MRYRILGLAAVTAAILTLAFLQLFGGSDRVEDAVDTPAPVDDRLATICSQPLAPLGQGPITKQYFEVVAADIDSVISAAEQGDVDGAYVAFFPGLHGLTHNVDGPLRDSNDDLATALCIAVAQIEAEFAFGGEAATIAEEAESIRELLRQVAAELELGE